MYLVAFFFLFFSLNNQQNRHHRHHHHHFHSSVKGKGMLRGGGLGWGSWEGRRKDRGVRRRGEGGWGAGMLSTSHTLGGCWRWWCRWRRRTPPGYFLCLWRRSCDSRFLYSGSGSCSQTVLGCKPLRPRRYWVLQGETEKLEGYQVDILVGKCKKSSKNWNKFFCSVRHVLWVSNS